MIAPSKVHGNSMVFAKKDIVVLSWRDFHNSVIEHLNDQFRLISFFASPGGPLGALFLNALFLKKTAGLVLLRTAKESGETYPSLTYEHAVFHCFEREIYERYNVIPTGHPWLKPLRSPPSEFYRVTGDEIHNLLGGFES